MWFELRIKYNVLEFDIIQFMIRSVSICTAKKLEFDIIQFILLSFNVCHQAVCLGNSSVELYLRNELKRS